MFRYQKEGAKIKKNFQICGLKPPPQPPFHHMSIFSILISATFSPLPVFSLTCFAFLRILPPSPLVHCLTPYHSSSLLCNSATATCSVLHVLYFLTPHSNTSFSILYWFSFSFFFILLPSHHPSTYIKIPLLLHLFV